jgi:RNA polymerase sigma factor (sigma-70 family)
MISRKILVEMFSTFIQFADDRFSQWHTDIRLKRRMQDALTAVTLPDNESVNELFWVLYWYQCWRSQPHIALGHLSAYLQETCYWAAHRTLSHLGSGHYSLSDRFQIAIAELPQILKSYKLDHGANLKPFASISFSNKIRDTLRQSHEADSRTNWGLLRKLSKKRLVEALQAVGLPDTTIAAYCLAWTCFKTYCAPRDSPATRQLAHPDPLTWEAIAQLYNQQRHLLPTDATTATSKTIEQWLLTCATHVRHYLYPETVSLNLPQFNSDSEVLANLSDHLVSSPLDELITAEEVQERLSQKRQMKAILTATLHKLPAETQTMLRQYYRDNLTQQQIATQQNLKQYTVSRRLNRAKATLLLALAEWSKETLHIALTSTVVDDMSVVLEEWLQGYLATSGLPQVVRDA